MDNNSFPTGHNHMSPTQQPPQQQSYHPPQQQQRSSHETPPDIEAMAEETVAELEAGNDGGIGVVNMETDNAPYHHMPAAPPLTHGPPDDDGGVGIVHMEIPHTSESGAPMASLLPVPPSLLTVTLGTSDAARGFTANGTGGGTSEAPAPASAEAADKAKRGSKRKTARTVRRVLVAKKEVDAAVQVMLGLKDLSKILDPADAKFLGEKYWVFTQRQLAGMIQKVSPPPVDSTSKMEMDSTQTEPTTHVPTETAPSEGQATPVTNTEAVVPPESQVAVPKTPQATSNTLREALLADMAARLVFDPAVTTDGQSGSTGSLEAAEQRLKQWEEKLSSLEEDFTLVEETSFSLDGPMQFLFPKGFKNFLDSIEIKTVYQFLCLKKTETGALCELYALWRHTCKLAKVSAPAAVRYFIGIHARIEGAISSIPPCDEKKRKWMNNSIVVMSGQSLEFLVEDRGIYTVRDFVDARTKDLSLALAAWRESKRLEPLKGSGKVAMISGWKAIAKEIVVIESGGDGEIVPNLKLMASSDLVLDEEPPPKRSRLSDATKPIKTKPAKVPPARTPASKSTTPKGASRKSPKWEDDLDPKAFLGDTLGPEVADFLAKHSIVSASELFESESSNVEHLLKAMVEADEAKDVESAALILKAWTDKLRDRLSSSATKKGRPQGKAIRPSTLRDASDPYDLLSEVTRRFLASMDIHNAETFLTTRTTEIASEFVNFRKREGMPELKGLGSIASVSGWKANCRRFARAMGREDIAVLEPADKDKSTTPSKRTTPMKATIVRSSESSASSSAITMSGVLFGKSRRMFAVQGESEIPMQYRFDVSLRNDESGTGIALYLTYKGSGPSIRPAKVKRIALAGSEDTIPLLADTTLTKSGDNEVDARALFSSGRKGCGLIDLHKYGVRPVKDQDLDFLKEALQSFVSGSTIARVVSSDKEMHNVGFRRVDVDKCQYLAAVSRDMQAGQTMPLSFPGFDTFFNSSFASESDRSNLLCSLFLLSRNDLNQLLHFLTETVVPSVSPPNGADVLSLKSSLVSLQRVDWISRRIYAQLSDDDEAAMKEELLLSFEKLKRADTLAGLSAEDYGVIVAAVHKELSDSFSALVEDDPILSKSARASWCRLASELYDEIFDIILSAVMGKPGHGEVHYKSLLSGAFHRVMNISWSPGIIPKLSFPLNPLKGSFESVSNVVVCSDTASSISDGSEAFKLVSVENVAIPAGDSSSDNSPDISFYQHYLGKIAVKIVSIFGKIVGISDFDADGVLESWRLGDVLPAATRAEIVAPWKVPAAVPSNSVARLQPETEEFFLGIVWPILREFGWRIEVESFPSERSFVAPKWKGDQQKMGKLAKLAKAHRDRRRQNLAREVNQIGFGAMTKLTKRVFAASGGMKKGGSALGKPAAGRKIVTVENICENYLKSLEQAAIQKDDVVVARAKEIVQEVITCFNSLASKIHASAADSVAPSQKYGADVFMQVLLVLPALLGRAEVELQEMNDSLELVHELTAYVAHEHGSIFPPSIRPPPEVYMTKGKRVPSTLLSRLQRKLSSGPNGASDELIEVLWDDDTEELSDFVCAVMGQTIACRATEADVTRKFRRIHVGYPGVVCRHCMGETGEGRYFFTTIESLTTLSTVFEKHIAKCPKVPEEIKNSVIVGRAKHAEQRKAFPNGAQQAYFNRLWDRLRSMKIAGTTSSSAVPLAKTNGISKSIPEESPVEMAPSSDEKVSFSESMDVLDFVRTAAPWKGTKEIDEALHQYYNCLDYGGRIYQTKSMPDHFSSAWLLNKVVPRRSRASLKRNMPG